MLGRMDTLCLLLVFGLFAAGCKSPDKGAGTIGAVKKWGVSVGERVQSTPAVGSDGTIYFGAADKKLHALNPKGHVEWAYQAADKVLSPRILKDGTIVFATLDGHMYRLSHDGRLIWKKRPREKLFGCPPALTSKGILFTAGDFVVVGLRVKDGSFVRLAKKLPPITTCITVNDKDILYFGSKKTLYAWGADGKKRWSFNVGKPFSRATLDHKGNIYIGAGGTGDGDGFILSLSPDGKERWRYHPPKLDPRDARPQHRQTWGLFTRPYIDSKGNIFVVRIGEGILSISPDGKKRNWLFPQERRYPFTGQLTLSKDGMIYAGATDNHFYAIDPKGKLHYKFMTFGRVFFGGALSKDQSTVYFGSEGKHFYALHTKKKK